LAYAALDAMRLAMPLDLCAYLHVVDGEGPQLYLRAPDLSAMTPTEAFDVFVAMREALDGDGGRCLLGGFEAVAVRTAGPVSRGVFVAGRRGGELEKDELEVVDELGAAMGDAFHVVEDAVSRAADTPPAP
jgi:hypothetical protein